MNAAELRASFAQQTETEAAAIARHNQIVETLRRHDGKKITRRLDKDLGKINAHLNFRYGMIYVVFPKPGTYDTYDHLLAYDSDPTVNLAKFEDWDACHGKAAVIRNQEREQVLASDKPERATKALAEFQAAARAFKAALEDNGSYEVTQAAKDTLNELFLWRIS